MSFYHGFLHKNVLKKKFITKVKNDETLSRLEN